MSTIYENCVACDHPLDEHFKSVDEKVRCLHSESGTSTTGVIGIPWTDRCDCVNFSSPETKRKKETKQREDRENLERIDRRIKELIEKYPELVEEIKNLKGEK